jgi:hypothetical protein
MMEPITLRVLNAIFYVVNNTHSNTYQRTTLELQLNVPGIHTLDFSDL